MPEFIEREAAIELIKKERNYTGKFSFEEEHAWAVGFQQGITFALSDIATIPAADVVPGQDFRDCRNELCLRCGEYKMRHKGACGGCRWRGVGE